MPRLAANLNWLYPDVPFLDRFRLAAQDGFQGVEMRSPYEAMRSRSSALATPTASEASSVAARRRAGAGAAKLVTTSIAGSATASLGASNAAALGG